MKKYFSKWLQTFSGSLKTSVETIPNEIPLQPVAISSEIIRQRQQQGEIK